MNIDIENCKNIILKLDEYYKDSINLASVTYPDTIKYKTNEWLIYIFYSCLLDYGMKSIKYHNNLIATYDKYPNIFNPKYVLKMDFNKLGDTIKENVHPRYPNVAVKKWLHLSEVLAKYDNLYDHICKFKSFSELNSFVKEINGYGQKTGGLLLRLICEANICSFDEKMNTIPLDRHDLEISYLTGITNKKTLTNKEIEELSNTYILSCRYLDINPIDLDKYLWNIGASYCNNKNCSNCPLAMDCKKMIGNM